MIKRRGATSDNGFMLKKLNENQKRKEKKNPTSQFLKNCQNGPF